MRWQFKPSSSEDWTFRFWPLILPSGWVWLEWVRYKHTVTQTARDVLGTWHEGYTEYWSRDGLYLGKRYFVDGL